jgi:hypothetical protein
VLITFCAVSLSGGVWDVLFADVVGSTESWFLAPALAWTSPVELCEIVSP